MLLPPSFGKFIRQLGAVPYSQGRIEPFSRTNPNSSAFGFGSIASVETSTVRFTIGPRDGLDLSTVTSGVVGVYKILESREDYLAMETTFDQTMRRSDGSWVVSFSPLDDVVDLWGACILTFADSSTVSAIVQVLLDNSKKPMLLPTQLKPISGFDTPDGPLNTVPTKVIQVLEKEIRTALMLDFSYANPLLVGTGTLSYAGGGNRYLPSTSGPLLQPLNTTPWSLAAKAQLEIGASNLIPWYNLMTTQWTQSSNNSPSVNELYYELPQFPDCRLVGWSVNQADGLNGTWQIAFSPIAYTGNTITGSAFVQITGSQHAQFEIGLIFTATDGTITNQQWTPVQQNAALGIVYVSWCLPRTSTPVSGFVQLAARASLMDRGESFQLAIGYPQLEYAATPTTRMIGTRAPDVLSFSPSYTFDNSYGKFIIEFSPNYAGTPGAAGPQLLLDTRDSSGRNGFWIGHRQDGLFEFGAADNTGSVFVRSASVMQLVENAVCTITAWFDSTLKSLRLDLNGVVMVEKTLGSFTVPTVLNQMKFGTKYDGTTASSFELVSFKHIMSTE